MKVDRKLELRPPLFIHHIAKFPGFVRRRRAFLTVCEPFTYAYGTVTNVFKKSAPLQQEKGRSIAQTSTTTTVQDDASNQTCKTDDVHNLQEDVHSPQGANKPLEDVHSPQCVYNPLEDVHSPQCVYNPLEDDHSPQGVPNPLEVMISKPPAACVSCSEDSVAYNTCLRCKKLDGSLPASSCKTCQRTRPLVYLCMNNHKTPTVLLSDNAMRRFNDFNKNFNKLEKASAVQNCNRCYPAIYNCPACHCIWPTVGECNCDSCKNICINLHKMVKLVKSSQDEAYLCPCQECEYLLPRRLICHLCSSTKDKLQTICNLMASR